MRATNLEIHIESNVENLVMVVMQWYLFMYHPMVKNDNDGWKSLGHQNKLVKLGAKVFFDKKVAISMTLDRKSVV